MSFIPYRVDERECKQAKEDKTYSGRFERDPSRVEGDALSDEDERGRIFRTSFVVSAYTQGVDQPTRQA